MNGYKIDSITILPARTTFTGNRQRLAGRKPRLRLCMLLVSLPVNLKKAPADVCPGRRPTRMDRVRDAPDVAGVLRGVDLARRTATTRPDGSRQFPVGQPLQLRPVLADRPVLTDKFVGRIPVTYDPDQLYRGTESTCERFGPISEESEITHYRLRRLPQYRAGR